MATSENLQYKKMTGTPVSVLVLQLGLPTTVSMLVTNLYNMADTWFVSQLGTSATGAVGIIFGLMAIIQAFGFMFGHGAGINASRLLGARNRERACIFSSSGFYFSLYFGSLITIFGLLFLTPLCRLLGSTDTILPYARTYAIFILLSAPALAASCVMNNILRYEGRAVLAMVGLGAGSFLNIGGDAFFIYICHMGIGGAGLSTMLSQYVSFGILLGFFLHGKAQCNLAFRYHTRRSADFWNIVRTGFPCMVRQGLASISTMFLNWESALYGDAAVAAMSVVARITNFLFSVGLGISQGCQPVSSFNYGARLFSRVKAAFRFTLLFSVGMMVVFGLFGGIFSKELTGAFLQEDAANQIALYAMRLQCITLPFIPITICCNMLFQSTGHAGRASLLSSYRSGLLFIPILLVFARLLGLAGIEFAQPAADALAAVLSLPVAWRFLKGLPADAPVSTGCDPKQDIPCSCDR